MLKSWCALLCAGAVFLCAASYASARGLSVVADEAVYANIARQIGGDRVQVVQMSRRARSPSLSGAAIVLLNGEAFDAWARKALAGVHVKGKLLEAARFSKTIPDSTPYYWYDFDAMRGLAGAIAAELDHQDPSGGSIYSRNLVRFDASLIPLDKKMKTLWHFYRDSKVLVTDNLFVPVIRALKFTISDERFANEIGNQAALANDAEPLREDIARRTASIFIYDSEKKTPLLTKLALLANEGDVPAVGVRETEPASLSYQEWMVRELNSLHGALNEAAP